MSIRRLSLVVSIVGVLALPAVAQAAWRIRVSTGTVRNRGIITWIGPWHVGGPWGGGNPTLRGAMRAFGPPSSEEPRHPGFAGAPGVADCFVSWNRIGLSVVFTTLGLLSGTCNPDKVVWRATVTGRPFEWVTWNGLTVGHATHQIRRLHSNAFWRAGVGWLLASKYSPFGLNPTRRPTVTAFVRSGRIAQFNFNVDAQGE